MFGIYNLCVSPSERDRGHGTGLLQGLMALAHGEDALTTLQCEPSLEPWYTKRGFETVGIIFVQTLDEKASHAIM